jgi:superfamily II DNA or RNA helicase
MDYAKNTLNVDMIRKIYSGKDKNIDSPITISTYQSLQNIEDNSFYREFGMIMVDEAHGATAKVLSSVIEKCTEAEYRFGFTGSLRDSVLNDLQLTGLLGPIKKSISTKELQDRKELSDLSINCVVLKYPEAIRKEFNKGKPNYQTEIDYVLESTNRNNFICNLAFEQKGTTLVLFNYVEKHGIPMFKIAQEKNKKHGRNIFFVSGSTHVDDREKIREIVEKEKDCIIFASSGTFSQGINIPSIENLIFTFSTKSFIRIIQSIGRALRMSDAKNKAKVYDIIDNISWKSKKNYGMKHAITRISFYEQEKFKYKIREIPFKPS